MATAIHQYEDKLLDFAYGELPAPEASAVESHLKSCARCTQALDQIRGVRATMSALPPEPAPIAGLDSLLAYAEQAAARNAAAPRAGIPWWRRIVAPLAGACALSLVAIVAIKTQEDGLDLSAEKAVLDAQPRAEAKAEIKEQPAPVAAAPAPPPIQAAQEEQKLQGNLDEAGAEAKPMEPKQVAQKMKSGKASGAANVLRGTAETDRRAKEDRNWDLADKKTAAKNSNEGYSQALGETKAPAEERQQRQVDELGSGIAAAQKESKSRREAPADQDFGNARGGYVQNKKAEEVEKTEKSKDGAKGDSAPSGISTASKPSAPPPPPAKAKVAAVSPPPAAEPQAASAREDKPSLGLSMPSTSSSSGGGSTGSGSLGTRSPSAYKSPPQPARDESDDEAAARGTEDLAGRKRLNKDVESEQRDRELSARKYLDSARAAGNNGNRQEEVKQSLMVLKTGVVGASRAEALNRLCTALEELGNEGQADTYCNALLVEFPTSAAAKAVANRRNNMQRAAPAPKASKTRSYDAESASEKAEPAKAAPAAADKPASAY